MDQLPENISELRNLFIQRLDEDRGSNKLHHLHPDDFNRVLKSDDWLHRFLIQQNNDVALALDMLWETCTWRRQYTVNDLNENNINMEYLEEGNMFVHNRDKQGNLLFIIICKNHFKSQNDLEQLKRCVIYFFELVEQAEKSPKISVFFDMQETGFSNLDFDFINYIIRLCKSYYPDFLNYVFIFEMPWHLNAAFKVLKGWLPPNSLEKIKFINKTNISDYIDLDQALTSWGGRDEFVYTFVPEFFYFSSQNNFEKSDDIKKRVHFASGNLLEEIYPLNFANSKQENGIQKSGHLLVSPSESVVISEGYNSELSGSIMLINITSTNITYKIKTTAPGKFRVRPTYNVLLPSDSETIKVSVLPGYTPSNIIRDKFLVMSFPTDLSTPTQTELAELWKSADTNKIKEHKLRCTVVPRNNFRDGFSLSNGQTSSCEPDCDQKMTQLITAVNHITQCNEKIKTELSYINLFQKIIIVLILLLALAFYFAYMQFESEKIDPVVQEQSCSNKDAYY